MSTTRINTDGRRSFDGNAQRRALAVPTSLGLFNPFSSMKYSVRAGELSKQLLSRWNIRQLADKPKSDFVYLTIGGRAHWLMLRESLYSMYVHWANLPSVTVVSDGSWDASDFHEVFSWWPDKIQVVTKDQVCQHIAESAPPNLAKYAAASPYGLKLASIIWMAKSAPVLFVDADILWFKDPAKFLGPAREWGKPKGISESCCYQRKDLADLYCPEVMQPPFVNGGIVATYQEFLPESTLDGMVTAALNDPSDGSYEQTIIATAVKLGGGFLPQEVSLVEFEDHMNVWHRSMFKEPYCSRHYVNWMRHLLYRDALSIRLRNSRRFA